MPVCARCAGIYVGAAVAAVACRAARLQPAPRPCGRAARQRCHRLRAAVLARRRAADAGDARLRMDDRPTRRPTGSAPRPACRSAPRVAWMVRFVDAAPDARRRTSGKLTTVRATAAEETQSGTLVLLCLASWAIPGAGHLWLGRRTKGLIFLIALPLMFAIGLAIHGRLFPFDLVRAAGRPRRARRSRHRPPVLRRRRRSATAAATCARSPTNTATPS